MSLRTAARRLFLAALPVALAFSLVGCDSDSEAAPRVERGDAATAARIVFDSFRLFGVDPATSAPDQQLIEERTYAHRMLPAMMFTYLRTG
ncbi:MAG: hypothetical protein FWD83_07185 [Promicromonosporaceae bacterium]|nr:hypothetical protein [Promicromonosporaceae bacterium]